jgi:NADPH-dependent 2,4-dienoyl-CoA reductase/sulfur reductase-like enzyme/rhodanese-related sulfurtransferase
MKVVIVGGVAGGGSAAARLRRLVDGAEIVILERDYYVSFANCGLPYHIGGEIEDRSALLLQTPDSLRSSLDIEVRIGHEVTWIDRKNRRVRVTNRDTGESYYERYDKLILAQGAAPVRPRIPGARHPRVFTLRTVSDMDAIKAVVDGGAECAVVIGGGFIGIELAEALTHRKLAVTVIEKADQIMPNLDHEMARDLQYHMESHGVKVRTGIAATSIAESGDGLVVTLSEGPPVWANLVILAAGVHPENALAAEAQLELGELRGIRVNAHMQTSDPDIYAVGDAVETPNLVTGQPMLAALAGPANRQGRIAAEHIAGRSTAWRGTLGTSVVKVFEMAGGGAGASEKSLRQLGRPYHKVYLHPSGHADYYPGTHPMEIKLLFAPEDGRVLGVQIVGYDGVDKRLDVVATAIHGGMTVFDLENLELAYAPPFGSAKDPVNMAGFIAANVLRGDLVLWYAEEFPAKTADGIILDVRGKSEYDKWHIPGATLIPLGSLRKRIGELTKDKPIWVYCRVGFRSYLAYRILVQHGFTQVAVLAGGTRTFVDFHETQQATGRPGVAFVSHAEEHLAGKPENLENP